MLRFVRHRLLAAGLILALSLPLSGCGAIMSTYLILVASSELDGAEAAALVLIVTDDAGFAAG